MQGAALRGLRVLEIGDGLAVAYCGRQFALWGADVVVVEGELGSSLRRRNPNVDGTSLLWEYVAAGKRSAAEETVTADAIALADVLITDDLARLELLAGVSVDVLRRASPDLTIVSLLPFGSTGAAAGGPASELTLQALAGYLSFNGTADRPPLRAPEHILAYACGANAFVAAAASLVGRLGGSGGRRIEVSELESIAALIPYLRFEYTGIDPVRDGGPGTGVRTYVCRDGYVSFVAPMTAQHRAVYGEVLGIADDEWPTFADNAPRNLRRDQLLAVVAGRTADKTVDEVFLGMMRRGVVCGRMASPQMLLDDEHLAARGFFQPVEHPMLGPLAMPGPPARLSRTPASTPTPAPILRLDARELGWTAPGVLPPGTSGNQRPLAGVSVVDVTQAWIGPFAAMLLADLGAEVIKIESHERPDVWRQYSANPVPLASVRAEEVNSSPNYNSVNRNKRSLCLDLKQEAGRALFGRLVEKADIVMENYTPRVMDRFGLGYNALRELNPKLVMASFSGFGKTGPLSDYKASGASIEGIAGWDYLHRHAGQPPVVMGFYQPDPITGLQMAASTLVALIHQRRTGEGQAIDGSMFEAAVGYIGELLLAAQVDGEPAAMGNRDRDMAPSGVYRSAGDDRWLALSVPNDAAWRALTTLLPQLSDPDLETPVARMRRHDEIDAAIDAWTAARSADEGAAQLRSLGIPAAPVRSLSEALASAELRSWFRPNTHVDLGTHRYNGLASRVVDVEARDDRPPPRLGEHGRQILRDRLGLSDAEIDDLRARNVTGEVLMKEALA